MELSSDKQNKNKSQPEYDFFTWNYLVHVGEKGNLYTWGSGEMG
jgi:alpha-tubulin suppressor-like RCC1 family protein